MAINQQPVSDQYDPSKPVPGNAPDAQTAADLIREKLDRIYGEAPSASQELQEAEASPHRSPHQQFMHELSASGKSLATIQTEWHNYYQKLPDDEKHKVWQEFYASQNLIHSQPVAGQAPADHQAVAAHKHEASRPQKKRLRDARSPEDIKSAIKHSVTAGGKLETKHHIQSLLFGLSMGLLALLIFLFGFFNEVIISPFIQPGKVNADTPLIVSSDTIAPTATPEVIIPKINVEIPADYSQTTIDENVLESALENGIVHYPTTVNPGQNGNTAYFGHSSNNIFNKGKYKFAFVLLHTLVPGDTFYLTYQGKVYAYKVISRTVVDPSEVGVLGPVPGQTATATLITCDPPGTSLKRLVVVGQQISPDPSGNTQAAAPTTSTQGGDSANGPLQLLGNGPTAWTRFIRTAFGKILTVLVLAGIFFLVVRWVNAPVRKQRALGY